MNVFLDANILVTVLNREYPKYAGCARVLSLAGNSRYILFTSPLCLGIAWYFAGKKSGAVMARKKITVLLDHLHITTLNHQMALKAMQNKKVKDFEDGLEYYSALDSRCKCIITDDTHDFYFSDVDVLSPEDFLEKYVIRER